VKRIPASVWVAAAGLAVAIAGVGWLTAGVGPGRPGWAQVAFAALVGALLLGGILAGRRLAWLWGYSLSPLLALLQAATLGAALWRRVPLPLPVVSVLAAVVVALAAVFLALRRPSALAFFGLVCPACLTPSRTAADLLFRQARCRRCGNVW
jgi:hypothetical protein